MDRLAEQVVAWHNRSPLAKRITIYDVHTIGVVALPFMRGGGGRAGAPRTGPAGPIEPVLGEDAPTETAQHALPPEDAPPADAAPSRMRALLGRLRGLLPGGGADRPLFSERFINRLSPRRVARFALRHGHVQAPGVPGWPQRVVPVDDGLLARAAGAWPYERYLMSAGIDAGASRSRVLLAYGAGSQVHVLGQRCLNPLALLTLAGLLLLLVALPIGLLSRSPGDAPTAAAAASSAASAVSEVSATMAAAAVAPSAPLPAAAASAPEGLPASAPLAPASPASTAAAAESAIAAVEAASAPASVPDIRPQLVPRRQATTPLPATDAAPAAASAAPTKAAATAPASSMLADELNRPSGRTPSPAAAGGKQVALVGPASASKAEAEALLERMRGQLGQTVREPGALQAQVFQTHEGWRAAIWPFGSREEAQLINATLVARGLRTKAVDF